MLGLPHHSLQPAPSHPGSLARRIIRSGRREGTGAEGASALRAVASKKAEEEIMLGGT